MPGRCEASNPESRDSGSGPSDHPGMTSEPTGRAHTMSATFDRSLGKTDARPFHLAIIAGLACALLIGKTLPLTRDLVSSVIEPFCMTATPTGSSLDTVEPI